MKCSLQNAASIKAAVALSARCCNTLMPVLKAFSSLHALYRCYLTIVPGMVGTLQYKHATVWSHCTVAIVSTGDWQHLRLQECIEGSISDYEGVNQVPKPMLPLVCVNTTAGTASEMTRFSIITDPARHVKMAIIDW